MKSRVSLRKIISYFLMFSLIFSMVQLGSIKNVQAETSLIEEVTIRKGGRELYVDKVAGKYVVDYIDTTVSNNYEITANTGWKITDISSDDTEMEKNITKVDGKDKYTFNVGKTQGSFNFVIEVESDDGKTKNTYTVKMSYSANESLQFSKIVVSDAANVLNNRTINYNDYDEDGNYKTTVGKNTENAKIEVYDSNGNVISKNITYNGSSNSTVPITGGDNQVTISVTNGTTTVSYNLIITKQGEALLKSLVPSAGSLSPSFETDVFDYEVAVAANVEKIAFTPTSVDNSSTITVDDVTVKSGRKSPDISLREGSNRIKIIVSTAEGDMQTYTVKVIRAEKETSNYLKTLTLSEGKIDPSFNKELTEYNVSVENDVSSIYVTPTAEFPDDVTIKVNGDKVNSGVPSKYINLDEGPNTITIKVTDEDNDSTTYILKVSRKYSEDNVNLSSLSLTSGKLSPLFDPETYLYSAKVDRVTEDVRVKFECQNEDAQVFINDKEYKSGQQSDKIKLNIGANLITLKVVAEDGKTTTTYKISVIRGEIEGKNDWVLVAGNWTFYDGYGNQIKNDWVKYDNQWYRLDVNGHLVTGWFKEDTDWYFLREDGRMLTGWYYEKGYWYYFHENGKMAYNKWYYLDGHKYYFNELGQMQTGWVIYGGHWYYFNKNGVMQKGWITYDKNKYYLNDDGTMRNGWLFTGKVWYYLDSTGKLVQGWQTINGKKYYFDSKGVMRTGMMFLDGRWINLNNL